MRILRGLRGLLCLLIVLAGTAHANPGYYLLTPYSQAGEWDVDTRFWAVRVHGGGTADWPEIGLRYGVNDRWTTELLASFEGPTLDKQSLDSWNWQNEILLTQGQSPFDLALHLQVIQSPDDGRLLQWGTVFQTELGLTRLNFNVVFEHQYQAGAPSTQLKLQWQALYPVARGVRLGVLGFSELGDWAHWSTSRQSNRAGPSLELALPFGTLQAAYPFGKTFGVPADMLTAHLSIPF